MLKKVSPESLSIEHKKVIAIVGDHIFKQKLHGNHLQKYMLNFELQLEPIVKVIEERYKLFHDNVFYCVDLKREWVDQEFLITSREEEKDR